MNSKKKATSKFKDIQKQVKIIEASGAFDITFYRNQLNNKNKKTSNPIKHYLLDGWKTDFDPHPCFSTSFYLEKNKDVADLGIHPFIHFVLYGYKEARHTREEFFLPDYLKYHPEITEIDINPLKHFTDNYGSSEGSTTTRATESIKNQTPQIPNISVFKDLPLPNSSHLELTEGSAQSDLSASHTHILTSSDLFDAQFYIEHYPDLSGCDSLLEHYLLYGGFEGRAASAKFDSKAYLANNPDVVADEINPLVHYLTIGQNQSRPIYAYVNTPQKIDVPAQEVNLLKSSPLFDEVHYVEKYPDVINSSYSPSEHFLIVGGKEGREASKYFNCAAYLEAYDDVRSSGINPLVHYLMFGQKEKRVAFETDLEISSFLSVTRSKKTVLLDNLPLSAHINYKQYRCALLIHAFYYDIFLEIFSFVKILPFSKIIVTTTKDNYEQISSFLEENWSGNFRVSIIPENRGRDIAPFLNENVDNLFDFDLICKIHTKKSPHLDTFGNQWKRHLVENLIGSRPLFDKVLSLFISDPELGIAYPEPMTGTNNSDWAANKDIGVEIFNKLNIELSDDELSELSYPPATMFWFRPKALKPIFNSYSYSDFPEEPIHFDGTLAHALERSLNYVCKKSGYSTLEYISLATLTDSNFKEAVVFDWLNQDYNKEKFIVVSHEATNTGAPKTALSLLNALQIRGKSCLTILLNGGEQEDLFNQYGPVINYCGQPLRESLLKILLENSNVKVICNTVVSYQAAKFFHSINLPVISLVHEFMSSGHFSNEMFSTLIESSDRVVYPAEFVLQDTTANIDIAPDKIKIMPQGIYDDAFPRGKRSIHRENLIRELGIPEDSFIVLSCGTVESRKGFDILIQAAKYIYSTLDLKNLHFIWVGKATEHDPYFQECMAELSSCELLKNNFHLMGAHKQVDRFFLAADLFALASRHDPFPGVVLEAMAANLPILCFDGTTGVNEAFLDHVGGLVCEHLNYIDMAKKITFLYKNPDFSQLMGSRNQSRVRDVYNFGRYTDNILEMFAAMDLPAHSETKFSVVVPVFNTPPNYLQKMIQSVLQQTYSNFELCIADGSDSELTRTIIKYYASMDSRIKYQRIRENKGIAENTNAALALATGDFLCMLDHDDILSTTALQEIYHCISNSDPDVVYTDEDKTDEYGLNYFAPVKKPDFDISLLEKYNYVTHLLTIRRSFFEEKIVKLNPVYDGAQDYDLILRCAEQTQQIQHISKVLYHWRVFENSTAKGTSASKNYAVEAGKKALEAHLKRLGLEATVSLDTKEFRYVVTQQPKPGVYCA